MPTESVTLIDDVISPYFLTKAIVEACETGEFVLYDPRSPEVPFADQDEIYPSAENCPAGPRLSISARMSPLVPKIINAFDRLEAVKFICIGSFHGQIGDPLLVGAPHAIRVEAQEMAFTNSRFFWPHIEESKIGTLTVEGILPQQARSGVSDAERRLISAAGMQQFTIVNSEIHRLIVRGVSIGELTIVKARIESPLTISRSELSALLISESQLSDLSLVQLRVGSGGSGEPFGQKGGGLHLTGNAISGNLFVGPPDDGVRAVFAQSAVNPVMAEQMRGVAISMLGPEQPWMARGWNSSGIEVRGYITLAQNKIGGIFQISGLDLAGRNESNGAFLNMNELSARSVLIDHNVISLRAGASILGSNLRIAEDINVLNNIVVRDEADLDAAGYKPNRKGQNWKPGPVDAENANFIFGFKGTVARDVILHQNLLDGVFGLDNPKIRDLNVLTLPAENDAYPVKGTEFCTVSPTAGASQFVRSAQLQGGFWLGNVRLLPVSELDFPTCYGSIILKGGSLENVQVHALFSDLLVYGTHVSRSVALQGRISGIVHLGNLQLKDGPLQLSMTGSPLRWCENGELLLDGARLWAIQADRDSYVRRDCQAASDPLGKAAELGGVRISVRGAHVEKITGSVRGNLAQEVDPGLFGLASDVLGDIAAPKSPRPSLASRLWAALPGFGSGGAAGHIATQIDPAALAQFSKLLKDNGYTSKATDLTIERISRQKWESGDGLDRVKWLLGWPIGWGYQIEWGFAYALVFLFVGAWVSAYYRAHPAASPPIPPWPSQNERGGAPAFGWTRAETYVGLCCLAAVAAIFAAWTPGWIVLFPDEALRATGVLVLLIAVAQALVQGRIWRILRRRSARRFREALPGVFTYHAWFFSLDRFLPAPGLHAHWGNYPRIGQAGRNYFYFHRLMGLVLVSIVAAGFAGLFD